MVIRKGSCWLAAACVLLMCSGCFAQQTMFVTKRSGTNLLQTPPNGFVFPVKCKLTDSEALPRLLRDCETVGFHVVVNLTTANDVFFYPRGSMRAGVAYDANDNLPCPEPLGSTYDQRCGVESLPAADISHETTGTCVPSCDPLTGICRCTEGTGSCTCLMVKRFTMQPTRYANVGDLSVCFNATSRRTPPLPQVCSWPAWFMT
jgi:hypothetical protein